MKTLDSFTVYGDETLTKEELADYSPSFAIEGVEDFAGAYDFIPNEELDDDEVMLVRERLISDPVINDFDENIDDIMEIDDEDFKSADDNQPGATADFLWHHDVMNISDAWTITASGEKAKGEGIIIAHPDSGYIKHSELCRDETRILKDMQKDFIDKDYDAAYGKASHGLATASVILGNEEGVIKGIAPMASLIPMRVAKVEKFLSPTPVLLGGGMRRLRNAIEHAVKMKADIISISLGGPRSFRQGKALKRAIDRAKQEGVIVMAAAGNRSYVVVYPARYGNVIAVAASNNNNSEWVVSARGKQVDITAPGEDVWVAKVPKSENDSKIRKSSGTSYSVANTAGVAALWLGHWGKSNLIQTFGGKEKLVDGFVRMLKHSASTDHDLPDSGFGAGIVDAKKLLELEPVDFVEI